MLFNKSQINRMELNNRIFRSATHEGMADENGLPKEELKDLYVQLARGGVGCIITGYTGIMQNGKSSLKNMLMIDEDGKLEKYKDIVNAVHENGSKIIMQLAHCGAQARSAITGTELISPSGKKDLAFTEDISKKMDEDDIEMVIQSFVEGAVRAKKAGFDGVQIHIAHGYLLCQFLSPYTNTRNDKWGGSVEQRFEIIKEVMLRTRKAVGDDFAIIAKLNIEDNREGGLRVEESLEAAKLLEKYSCDAIELSCGVVEDGFYLARGRMPMRAIEYFTSGILNADTRDIYDEPTRLYNLEGAKKIKKAVNIPIILVGGIRDKVDMEMALSSGMDYVSMSRALIREPDLPKKYMEGNSEKSKCLACNYCVVGAEVNTLTCYGGQIK